MKKMLKTNSVSAVGLLLAAASACAAEPAASPGDVFETAVEGNKLMPCSGSRVRK